LGAGRSRSMAQFHYSNTPMASRFKIQNRHLHQAQQYGISVNDLLQESQLPADFFDQDKILATTWEFFAFWRAIQQLSSDPLIGFKFGSSVLFERYDPIAMAALCSYSFRDALDRISRYKRITCPEKITVTHLHNGESSVEFTWLGARETEPTTLIDVCFSWLHTVALRGIGSPVHPLRVELMRHPKNQEALEEYFGCRIRFNAAKNILIYRTTDLDRPFETYNAETLASIHPQLEAELQERQADETIEDKVRLVLHRLIAGQRPSVREVARHLHLSSRTLQRRLTESGVSFQELLEEVRRDLARHYLTHSNIDLSETAYLLGFEDPNSFFRAFHQWEGQTPRNFLLQELKSSRAQGPRRLKHLEPPTPAHQNPHV
jgi:AraC-like DNA-binding protein